MLTKLSSTVTALALATGLTVTTVAMAEAAMAAPCQNGGGCNIHQVIHRRGGGGSSSGAGGTSDTGPGLGCPTVGNTIVCAPAANGPAPVPHIPTIDVAYNARDQITVPAPHVHTAPRARTYVQIKTGLWVNPADFSRQSITVTVPDQSVTATATPQSVTWNMGEASVTCGGAGTAGGTQCGYTYDRSSAGQPGGKYRISATITWTLAWTCTGTCDQPGGALDPLTMTTAARLAVGEVQTESRPG